MKALTLLPVFLLFLNAASSVRAQQAPDWPAWRGQNADGQAAPDQKLPVRWSENENVLWRAEVRGRGHSSPTVVGNRIYLATADLVTEEQLVVCFDRATGQKVWETPVHVGNIDTGGHKNGSQASSTVAWDGERLYINFLNNRAVFTTALDTSGKILWQQRVSDFQVHQGFGSSPVVYKSVVLVTADHRGGGKISGLDKQTGKILWQQDRPKIANYASPAIVTAAGRVQAVLAGCNLVASFEPLTGKKLWEVEGSTEETVVTAVTDGSRIFLGGGYPKSHTMAMEADGSGKIAWQNTSRSYVPSMLVKDGYVYAVQDGGQAVCWKSDTGEELWREKVDRDFYGSPVMMGSLIFVTNMNGVTSVLEATPERFKLLSQNVLGDEAFASPTICGNRIYLRAAKKGDMRQEYLWCIGE